VLLEEQVQFPCSQ
jgi:hypothetical protein